MVGLAGGTRLDRMMNIEALEKVITALKSITDDQFDVDYWSSSDKISSDCNCRTVACAAGWYVIKNPDCGLIFSREGTVVIEGREYIYGLEACEHHFGLTSYQAVRIFGCGSYRRDVYGVVKKKQVIRRIRAAIDSFVRKEQTRLKLVKEEMSK